MTHTEHTLAISAAPEAIFDFLADVSQWPLYFPPTVAAREVAREGEQQTIQLCAVGGNGLHLWQSQRRLDRDGGRLNFSQVQRHPDLESMQGTWVVEASEKPGETTVRLLHDFTMTPGASLSEDDVERIVDDNSMQEIAWLKRALEEPPLVVYTFSDEVHCPGDLTCAYDFIYRVDEWPNLLPHVSAVTLRENTPGLQIMDMTTRSPDGSEHTTSSGRLCIPNKLIEYKQFQRPAALDAHLGMWEFQSDGSGTVTVRSTHTVGINMASAREVLGDDCTEDRAQQAVRKALGTNSRATMNKLADAIRE